MSQSYIKSRQLLAGAIPRITMYHEKMNLFDGTEDEPDTESEGSHTGSYNLNDDLKAESELKPATQREGQREESSVCRATGTAASRTREDTITLDKEILKNKGDPIVSSIVILFSASITLSGAIALSNFKQYAYFLVWMMYT